MPDSAKAVRPPANAAPDDLTYTLATVVKDPARFRDAAIAWARRGFRVFPLKTGKKTPAFPGWQESASSDPERVRRVWSCPVTGEPLDYNIGYLTGDGLAGVDVDDKNGKRGSESLDWLELQCGALPATLTVRTPTGGRHLLFRVPEGVYVGGSAGKIGEGIDVRGDDGLLVAPGSEIDGVPYVVLRDAPTTPAAMPVWTVEKVRGTRPDRAASRASIGEIDAPEAIERAMTWLRDRAPLAVEGAGGDAAAYGVAARVGDFGISEATALDLMLSRWNERCSPPWAPDELAVKVANAFAYRQAPLGSTSADEFEDMSEAVPDFREKPGNPEGGEAVPESAERKKLFYLTFEESRALALDNDVEPLVEDVLDQGALSVVYGDSNVGKTFAVLDMAYCVATGRPFVGKPVRQKAVVYVASEGGRGIHKRVEALAREHGDHGADVPLFVVPCPVDLLRPGGDLKPLARLIRGIETERGVDVGLVVLDTLSRALAGGDENSSVDMGAFVASVDKLRTWTVAHVAIVHHTGKDSARGARGHSLLRAAVDTEIEIAAGALKVTKQRDMEGGFKAAFTLRAADLGIAANGRKVRSATVLWRQIGDFEEVPLTGAEEELLAAVVHLADEQAGDGPVTAETKTVSSADVLAFLVARRTVSRNITNPTSASVSSQLSTLVEKGSLVKVKKGRWRAPESTRERLIELAGE